MAPKIVIYFHKIQAVAHGATKKGGYRTTFTLDRPSLAITQVASKFTPILAASKAAKKECTKATPVIVSKVISKKRKISHKKRGKALAKKSVKVETIAVKTEPKAEAQLLPNQIWIGSIPIELPSTMSVMATSVQEDKEKPKPSPKVEVAKTPKRIEVVSKPKNVELSTVSTKGAKTFKLSKGSTSTITENNKKGKKSKNKKGAKGKGQIPQIPDTPEAALYPLSAFSAEKSKGAKSEKEKEKWAFFSGFLLAKEMQHVHGVPFMPTDNTRPYNGPVTRSRAQIMPKSPLEESITSRKPHNQDQPTVTFEESSTSSGVESPRKSMSSVASCENPLHGDSESLFEEDDFPAEVISKFQKMTTEEESQCTDMPVLMTGTTSFEEQVQEMQRKLAEKDAKIAALAAQVATQASTLTKEHVHPPEQAQSSAAPVVQADLKRLIAEGIRDFQASMTPPVLGYRRPYPTHYDTIPFPPGYQKPHFEKFDGINGSPQEHLAHFYSASGESAQSDALLIRQFVQSLKGSAFTWYTQLQPGSILTWDDMQRAFLAQFVSSKKKVSIIDLADARQKSNESVNDFITRWRSLNLQCSEKLTEQSAVQMCSNNLSPEIATFVGTAEPQTFDALVSKASNVERQIARQKSVTQKPRTSDERKIESNKKPTKKGESMATFVNTKENNNGKNNEQARRPSLKERKEVKYSFHDDDVEAIFKQLMKEKAIKLPEPKRPSEVDKTDDPKYCPYHRIVSHPLKECYVLKNVIQAMIKNGELVIEESSSSKEAAATSNTISLVEDDKDNSVPTVSLPEGAIRVAFQVDGEVSYAYSYPSMPRAGNPGIPTFYEVMTEPNLNVWNDTSGSEVESADEWQTHVSKRTKKMLLATAKSSKRPNVVVERQKPTGRKSIKKNKKKKYSKKVKLPVEEENIQPARVPITLSEYLPAEFFKDERTEENEQVAQSYMVEMEENDTLNQEADEITLRSG